MKQQFLKNHDHLIKKVAEEFCWQEKKEIIIVLTKPIIKWAFLGFIGALGLIKIWWGLTHYEADILICHKWENHTGKNAAWKNYENKVFSLEISKSANRTSTN